MEFKQFQNEWQCFVHFCMYKEFDIKILNLEFLTNNHRIKMKKRSKREKIKIITVFHFLNFLFGIELRMKK